MEYTHYYKFSKNPSRINNGKKKFADAVNAAKTCIDRLPKRIYSVNDGGKRTSYRLYPLCGGNGYGVPIFRDDRICFNGDAKHNQNNATFTLLNDYNYCNFCNTARKPYDVAVCIALLCFKHYFCDDFYFTSDGDIEKGEEGWKRAKRITDKYFTEECFA